MKLRGVGEELHVSHSDIGVTLFSALSGQGLCHMALGQYREAVDLFRRTLAVHPHLDAARHNLALALAEAVRGNGHRLAGPPPPDHSPPP